MPSKRTTTPCVACAHCGAAFVPAIWQDHRQKLCSRACADAANRIVGDRAAHIRERERARRAPRIAAARAFVADVNARTVCAHCGVQPVEWHNPEHVELNRQSFRIGAMAGKGYTVDAIQAELDRCTPLCRKCHMAEDGRSARMAAVRKLAASRRRIGPPKPCSECGRISERKLCHGLCHTCDTRRRRALLKQPRVPETTS